jgi:hypothetical protein
MTQQNDLVKHYFEVFTAGSPHLERLPTGLGIHIMDSRVGTEFPASVRDDLSDLLYEWK